MPLTEEQAEKIKEHLLKQLANIPEDRRDQVKEQLESMTTSQVEEFVEQNKLNHLNNQCIFCSIVEGENPSFKVAEDEENIAILEINPLSKGHTLIVPKKHSENLPASSQEFAKKVAERLKERFKPKEISANAIKIMEHPLIEVIPLYGNETERKPASEIELKEVQNQITKSIAEPPEEVSEEIQEEPEHKEEIYQAKPRIP